MNVEQPFPTTPNVKNQVYPSNILCAVNIGCVHMG